jgi:hypothetical protein
MTLVQQTCLKWLSTADILGGTTLLDMRRLLLQETATLARRRDWPLLDKFSKLLLLGLPTSGYLLNVQASHGH